MPPKKTKPKRKNLTERMYRMIIENVADWVLIVDHETHKWIYSNRACERILGYKVSEILKQGTFTSPIISLKAQKEIKKNWKKLEKEGFLSGVEIELIHKNGRKAPMNYSEGLIRDKRGKITHRIALIRDVSEMKKCMSVLESAKHNLEEKVSELQRMNKLMVGREVRMIQLKKEVAELKEKIKTFQKQG